MIPAAARQWSKRPSQPGFAGVGLGFLLALKEIGHPAAYPVNPNYEEIEGLKCYGSVLEIDGPVDMVNVFRQPSAVPEIVDEAARIGARWLWLQLGVVHHEAAARAEALGLRVIMDRCLAVELRRLSGR